MGSYLFLESQTWLKDISPSLLTSSPWDRIVIHMAHVTDKKTEAQRPATCQSDGLPKKRQNQIFFFFSGCAESLLLVWFFSSCNEQGLLSSCDIQASHCSGFSLQSTGSLLWSMDLVAPRHLRSSLIRDWTRVSCLGRWILYPWATREAQNQDLNLDYLPL